MPLFQTSVLKKYLCQQDKRKVEKAYREYADYFLNPEIQENIRNSKEEQFQEGFLRELFVKILRYKLNPDPNFNLTTELKDQIDREIDQIVYQLYGLTDEEIKIVEQN